ncbi:hypothetical protein TNCV_3933061 [Trichonephila clavipes]|nr:hypothetical protein TNCV_3933061 [Trichonephila clavipes]
MKLSLRMNHASVCNTTLVGFESGDTVETGCRATASCTGYYDIIASLTGSHFGSFTDKKHVANGCSTIDPDYTPSCHTRSTLEIWQLVKPAWSAIPQEHIQSLFESMPRRGQR